MTILREVPEGARLIAAAERRTPPFLGQLKLGDASFTESTFVRTYSLLNGEEKTEVRNDLTLSRHLNLAEAVVDLAHELVHFNEKEVLDPYAHDFNVEKFVRHGIEGPGGELPALATQCAVAWALEAKYRDFPPNALCQRYRSSKDHFDLARARRDYYSLGQWHAKTSKELRKLLPELNAKPARFSSSYASKPYPVALAEEFSETRKAACQNNRRKHRLIAAQAESGRKPAAVNLARAADDLVQYDQRFCRDWPSDVSDQ